MKLTQKELDLMRCLNRFHSIRFWKMSQKLSKNEGILLHHICKAEEEDGSVPVSVLAKAAHMHPAGVSRLMRSLEDNGLIIRNIDSKDRRNMRVKTTAKGQEIDRKIGENIHSFWEDVFSRIPDEDVKTLTRIMNQVADSMEYTIKIMQEEES